MTSKRQCGEEGSRSKFKGKGRASARGRYSNPYDISFKDETQKARHNTLVKRKVVNNRYLDNNLLEVLELNDGIFWMLKQVGWTAFVNIKYPTYIRLTLEFLISIEVSVLYREGCVEGHIFFRLFKTKHQLNLEQFNTIFNLPYGGE